MQFHFHHPSEHLIAGKSFAMEADFVHANAAGSLAVVGALMTPGRTNAAFKKIVSTMPQTEGPAVKADAGIDPNGLLPSTRSYYRYLPARSPRHPAARPSIGSCSPIQSWWRKQTWRFREALFDERAPRAEGEPPLRAPVGGSAPTALRDPEPTILDVWTVSTRARG